MGAGFLNKKMLYLLIACCMHPSVTACSIEKVGLQPYSIEKVGLRPYSIEDRDPIPLNQKGGTLFRICTATLLSETLFSLPT